MDKHRILILGGTTESRQLALALSRRDDVAATLSLAGRTSEPIEQPVPVRSGGFGGSAGLADYLSANGINLLIDATHPFATRISANADIAAGIAGIELFALRRPAWNHQEGDRWTRVSSVSEAVDALGTQPRNVFLAIGRQEAHQFENAQQHRYLIRSVDPVEPALALPQVKYILSTGPFDEAAETALLREHAIDIVVAKNSGGAATYGKIAAARALGIEVVLVERQKPADVRSVETVDDALRLIDHRLSPG